MNRGALGPASANAARQQHREAFNAHGPGATDPQTRQVDKGYKTGIASRYSILGLPSATRTATAQISLCTNLLTPNDEPISSAGRCHAGRAAPPALSPKAAQAAEANGPHLSRPSLPHHRHSDASCWGSRSTHA
jgi:hypothetical protein